MHTLAPSPLCLPSAHMEQLVASAPLYVPVPHAMHEVAFIDAWYLPASHASQKAMPSAACFLPAAHALQLVSPEAGAYRPAPQLVHASMSERLE